MKFPYTQEGYLEAVKYLKSIGRWKYTSNHGQSVDGWSITQTANDLYAKNNT